MKSLKLAAAILLVVPVVAMGDKEGERDHNPTKDPDVEQGYKDHQEQHRQKDQKETYTIHTTGEGDGGRPTSGGHVPSDVKDDAQKKKD